MYQVTLPQVGPNRKDICSERANWVILVRKQRAAHIPQCKQHSFPLSQSVDFRTSPRDPTIRCATCAHLGEGTADQCFTSRHGFSQRNTSAWIAYKPKKVKQMSSNALFHPQMRQYQLVSRLVSSRNVKHNLLDRLYVQIQWVRRKPIFQWSLVYCQIWSKLAKLAILTPKIVRIIMNMSDHGGNKAINTTG